MSNLPATRLAGLRAAKRAMRVGTLLADLAYRQPDARVRVLLLTAATRIAASYCSRVVLQVRWPGERWRTVDADIGARVVVGHEDTAGRAA